jgi:hypothetical protein
LTPAATTVERLDFVAEEAVADVTETCVMDATEASVAVAPAAIVRVRRFASRVTALPAELILE